MADPTPSPQTNPLASGGSTSEGKLTLVNLIIGFGALVTGVIAALSEAQAALPDARWIGTALAVLGVVQMIFAQLGYAKSRATVKAAAIGAGAAAAQLVTTNADAARVMGTPPTTPITPLRGPTP